MQSRRSHVNGLNLLNGLFFWASMISFLIHISLLSYDEIGKEIECYGLFGLVTVLKIILKIQFLRAILKNSSLLVSQTKFCWETEF